MEASAAGGHTEKIFDIVYSKDDVNWKSVIYDLVKEEQMDPWDIDITRLTQQYIQVVKHLQDHDFRVSGKMVLAAAILLKIKSKRLVGHDLEELDRLIASREEGEIDDFYEDLDYDHTSAILDEDGQPELIPRTPQPRVRKVSVYDLVNALEQALEVKKRRVLNSVPESTLEIPRRAINVSRSIKDIYRSILDMFKRKEKITFSRLLPESPSKEAKVFTFIPLLHLANTRKIGLEQEEHFGEIDIFLRSERIVGEDPMKDFKPDYVEQERKAAELKAQKAAAREKKANIKKAPEGTAPVEKTASG